MKELLHDQIYKIISEGNECFEDSKDITFKVLKKVQARILPSMPGYIGDLHADED